MIGRRFVADPLALPGLDRWSVAGDAAIGLFAMFVVVMTEGGLGPVPVIVGVLVGLALMCRRAAPSAMMALALASAVIQVVTRDITVSASLLYAVLFYTAGAHPNSRVRGGSLAVALAGSAVAAWAMPRSPVLAPVEEQIPLSETILGFVGVAVLLVGGWTLGFVAYQRRSMEQARVAEQISELERDRLLDLYDEQARRSELARDVHDVVAHSLAVVVAQAEGARLVFDQNPQAVKESLAVIAGTGRQALADVRGVLDELRSTGTVAEHDRDDRRALYERMGAAGMVLRHSETGDPATVSASTVRVAAAVLTEALTNALKYADLAEPVRVAHEWTDGGCRLAVVNAISATPLAPGGAGHGLRGMAERAELAGGTLTSAVVDGEWRVELVIPASVEGRS